MKKAFAISLLCFFSAAAVFCQQILTAGAFFQSVSEYYGTIKDYESAITIKENNTTMRGQVSFKRPNLLRIDFTNPESQVICFNGDLLTIYLPRSRAIFNQTVSGGNSGANLATPQGLSLMSRYYSIAYETGQQAVPLEEGSSEMVVKLILSRKSTSEGFRSIKLSIDPNTKLIRRIEGISTSDATFVFDFTDYRLNTGMPDTRFIYEAPSSANNYNNFLYTTE